MCFSRVCYFRHVVSLTYSLSVLGDLPMKLVICIAQETYGFLDPPLPGDLSDPSDQAFPCLTEVQTNQRVNCQATLTRIPFHNFDPQGLHCNTMYNSTSQEVTCMIVKRQAHFTMPKSRNNHV